METTLAIDEGDDLSTPSDALAPGTVLLNGQYTIEEYLASGGFGITYKARDSLDRVVVIKECFPEAICTRSNKTVMARSRSHMDEYQSLVEMFVREARSVAKLDHPNIVRVHQVFEDNETAYMALDHIQGLDLLDWIESGKALPPEQVKGLLLKVLNAIDAVHNEDMLHRDISPDNILIDKNGSPVLIDFGAAREEASKKSRALSAMLVVKDGYSPQEFYISGSQQTACSDLYALGATFYHLITGDAPPNSQTRLSEIAGSQPDPYEPLVGRFPDYQEDFLCAIDEAMSVFPADRIQTASDWILRVDAVKRREIALAAANHDEQIALTVMELITQTEGVPEQPARQRPKLVAVADAPQTTTPKARPKARPIPHQVEEDTEPTSEDTWVAEDAHEPEHEDATDLEVEHEDAAYAEAEHVEAEIYEAPAPSPVIPAEPIEEDLEHQYFEPECAAIERGGGLARNIAITVILWSIILTMIVTMFDGWPTQLGYAAEPILNYVMNFAVESSNVTTTR